LRRPYTPIRLIPVQGGAQAQDRHLGQLPIPDHFGGLPESFATPPLNTFLKAEQPPAHRQGVARSHPGEELRLIAEADAGVELHPHSRILFHQIAHAGVKRGAFCGVFGDAQSLRLLGVLAAVQDKLQPPFELREREADVDLALGLHEVEAVNAKAHPQHDARVPVIIFEVGLYPIAKPQPVS
jgi:hypothetical protein